MELFIFGQFPVVEGKEEEFAEALREVVKASRKEAGCVEIHGYRGRRDGRLFYIHSRWKSEEAFEEHACLPHTLKFIERAEALTGGALQVTRAERMC